MQRLPPADQLTLGNYFSRLQPAAAHLVSGNVFDQPLKNNISALEHKRKVVGHAVNSEIYRQSIMIVTA
ncbi:MAG: hypothetical protein RPV21_02405 [Candidatus Sedimenticola sp. (ex Thyasira tokunagai)]